jgi:hypothetical protein
MPALGSTPFGLSPFGLGTPIAAADEGGVPLAQSVHAASEGAKHIDPKTRQYAFLENGRMRGMPSVPQMVQLVAQTVVGSSAVRGLGNDLDIQDAGEDLEAVVKERWRAAYADLVRRGLIELLAVDVERYRTKGGSVLARTRIRFRDLTTGREDSLTT